MTWTNLDTAQVERERGTVIVLFEGHSIAQSKRALRVTDDTGAIMRYLPQADVQMMYLRAAEPREGRVVYTVNRDRQIVEDAAWSYLAPAGRLFALKDLVGFNPAHFEIQVDDVTPAEVESEASDADRDRLDAAGTAREPPEPNPASPSLGVAGSSGATRDLGTV